MHFTGGIFTTFNSQSKSAASTYATFDSFDYRSWGSAYWWQNTRYLGTLRISESLNL